MGGKALPASLSWVSLVKFFPRSKMSVDFQDLKTKSTWHPTALLFQAGG